MSNNISFFIPAYNCAGTIEESVNSIIHGNFTEGDEIVIVDDGSSDNTWKVLNSLKNKYSNIKLFQHKNNMGGAVARNTAIKNCKNELLFCLD